MKLLLKIRYIGSAYCGFQSQKNGRTVQEVLTEASRKVFGEPCFVTGCSRTDAGVHALGFCCTVEPQRRREDWCGVPAGKVHRAYESVLPPDISVIAAAEVPDGFHPRYDCTGKRYIYRFSDALYRDPFEEGRSERVKFRLTDERLDIMKCAAEHFTGRHDFSSFMASGSKITDAVRTVSEACVTKETEHTAVFSVSADGFLYNMVRIMAGTLIDTARELIAPEDIPGIIEARDRSRAGRTASPCGLYLDEVYYRDTIFWQCD